jgi:hypothetical protein
MAGISEMALGQEVALLNSAVLPCGVAALHDTGVSRQLTPLVLSRGGSGPSSGSG